MKIEQIQKLARKLDRILEWVGRLLYFALGLVVFGTVFLAGMFWARPDWFVLGQGGQELTAMIRTLKIGSIKFTFQEGFAVPVESAILYSVIVFLVVILALGFLLVILHKIRRILAPMMEGQPFQKQMASRIRNLGLWILCWLLYIRSAEGMRDYLGLRLFHLVEHATGNGLASLRVSTTFSLEPFLFFGLMILLSFVFEYGWELQRLSDETV